MKIELSLLIEGEGKCSFFGEIDNLNNEVKWTSDASNYKGKVSFSKVEYDKDLFEMQKRLIELAEESFSNKNYSLILNINRYN